MAAERPAVLGASTPDSGDARLHEDINMFLHNRGKSPGIDGVLTDMIRDGGETELAMAVQLHACGSFP